MSMQHGLDFAVTHFQQSRLTLQAVASVLHINQEANHGNQPHHPHRHISDPLVGSAKTTGQGGNRWHHHAQHNRRHAHTRIQALKTAALIVGFPAVIFAVGQGMQDLGGAPTP